MSFQNKIKAACVHFDTHVVLPVLQKRTASLAIVFAGKDTVLNTLVHRTHAIKPINFDCIQKNSHVIAAHRTVCICALMASAHRSLGLMLLLVSYQQSSSLSCQHHAVPACVSTCSCRSPTSAAYLARNNSSRSSLHISFSNQGHSISLGIHHC